MSKISIDALKCLSDDAQNAVRAVAKHGFKTEILVGYAWEFAAKGFSGDALVNKIWSAARNENRYCGSRAAGRVVAFDDDSSGDGQADYGGDPANAIDSAQSVLELVEQDRNAAARMVAEANIRACESNALAKRDKISKRRAQQIIKAALENAQWQDDLFGEETLEAALDDAGVL